MGYESRIFVAEKHTVKRADGTEYVFSTRLADMKLSRMYNGFTSLFTKTVDWKIYGDNDVDLTKDCYGDTCTYTDNIESVIEFLEKCEQKEHYRRVTPALAMLKAYAAENWDDDQGSKFPQSRNELIVIHYGY